MVRRAFVQRSLVEVLLPDGDKLWDPALRTIDAVLTDDGLVDQVVEALGRRHRQSRRRGRLGTPAEVVLRMLVLKHLFDWSFDECEREVRGSLVYRPFCRIDGERVPDAKTLIRLSHCLGPEVLKGLVERLVAHSRRIWMREPHFAWSRWKVTPCELVAVKSWMGITAKPSVISRFLSTRGMVL